MVIMVYTPLPCQCTCRLPNIRTVLRHQQRRRTLQQNNLTAKDLKRKWRDRQGGKQRDEEIVYGGGKHLRCARLLYMRSIPAVLVTD